MVVGFATNNEAELMTVKQGLTIAVRENYHRVIVEGDSAMVTRVLQKLQQGTPWDKIRKSWRTARLIQQIGQIIPEISYVMPMHVRRGGNEAVDYLANWGYKNEGRKLDINQHHQAWNIELRSLQIILEKYKERANNLDRGAMTRGMDGGRCHVDART